ncbi:Phosphate transport regulator (distant homolog of PhoU) [hydrothermal vent metagenome]|uniref:Phosphate transport regulator (Distant homolog of PhoU) n=1 Tax=hydrothermal vent metagenome TaxID=652676 RepID=A0A3B0Y0C9_9ZZZZ
MANFLANVFGNSPVKPMQKHMAKVFSCVSKLPEFFDAVFNKEWDKVTQLRDKISTLEREADELKKNIRLQLPTGMMLPVSRRDLLEVLTMQDKIANKAKDISGLIFGRKMEFPNVVIEHYTKFVSRCVDATKQAQRTINELDELVETGFRGKEVRLVESMIVELDAIEQDTDSIQVKIRFALFEIEKDLPPIDAMFLYKIIEWTGEVADLAQRVGSRLQLMLAK